MAKTDIKKFKHITLTHKDLGVIACIKTHLYRKDTKLYHKLRMSADAENYRNYMGQMSDGEKNAFLNGGAFMYQLMTNPEFLKECKNIYE